MLKLIGTLSSPFVRKVRVVLALKTLPYQMLIDAPSQPGSRIAESNPLCKIPVLVGNDGESIYDSAVIAEYLEAIAPNPSLLPVVGLDRIAVKRWEALADGLLDAAVAILFERRRESHLQSTAWIQKQEGKIHNALSAMSTGLGELEWCCGHSMTLADVTTGVALGYLDYRFPEIVWRNRYPNLVKLYGKLSSWQSFIDTFPPK